MNSIQVENAVKYYGKKKALDGVSLSVGEGELYGLLGVNGAGKTTLIKLLCGLAKKDGGRLFVGGFSVDGEMEEIKKIVDVSPQESALAPNLTVNENLRFFQEIYGAKDEEQLASVIRAFSLDEVLDAPARTLSGGWMRRLSIAIALVTKPKILFLDEPTLGLDVLARRELWESIRRQKGKITIVLTSHYLEEIEALCDRVAILSRGSLLAEGSVEDIKKLSGKDSFEDAFVAIVEKEGGR